MGCLHYMNHILVINRISQTTARTSLEKLLDPRDPIASRGGPHQIFDFPAGADPLPTTPPLDPPMLTSQLIQWYI